MGPADRVTAIHHHPSWPKSVTPDGRLVDRFPSPTASHSRGSTPVCMLSGAIYIGTRRLLLERQTDCSERTQAFVMPPERSLDVDAAWDLHLADLALREGVR